MYAVLLTFAMVAGGEEAPAQSAGCYGRAQAYAGPSAGCYGRAPQAYAFVPQVVAPQAGGCVGTYSRGRLFAGHQARVAARQEKRAVKASARAPIVQSYSVAPAAVCYSVSYAAPAVVLQAPAPVVQLPKNPTPATAAPSKPPVVVQAPPQVIYQAPPPQRIVYQRAPVYYSSPCPGGNCPTAPQRYGFFRRG